MSEYKYWKCDRCGKKTEKAGELVLYSPKKVFFWVAREGGARREVDLCEPCSTSFEKWLRAAEAVA